MTHAPYPLYSRAERIADAAVHFAGIGAAVIGIAVFFGTLAHQFGWGTFTATLVYAAALLTMLTASAAYHLYAYTPARPILRRLDHAAIYFKIAGTFTPLSVLLGTAFGYVVLALVWGLALSGAAMKLMAAKGKMSSNWVPYVALGWVGVALFVPLSGRLPGLSLSLMVAGGLLYTAGVLFFRWESLRFSNAIWHGFVIAASACFFIGIATATAASL